MGISILCPFSQGSGMCREEGVERFFNTRGSAWLIVASLFCHVSTEVWNSVVLNLRLNLNTPHILDFPAKCIIIVYVYMMCVCVKGSVWMPQYACWEQLCGVCLFLLALCGFLGWNSGHHACSLSAYTWRVISLINAFSLIVSLLQSCSPWY